MFLDSGGRKINIDGRYSSPLSSVQNIVGSFVVREYVYLPFSDSVLAPGVAIAVATTALNVLLCVLAMFMVITVCKFQLISKITK